MDQISIQTNIRNYQFPSCLMNASGSRCTDLLELQSLYQSPHTGAVVSKSATFSPREGNPHPRYYHDLRNPVPLFSINSTGLANAGYQFYQQLYNPREQWLQSEGFFGKPYWMSIAGLTPDDNLAMIASVEKQCRDLEDEAYDGEVMLELNLSCPNIVGKPQIGYDFEATENLLERVFELDPYPDHICLGLKLPPYFDLAHHDQMAEIIRRFPIGFITCVNSLGNTLVIDPDTETPTIYPKGGFGGLGGVCIKPVALANVYRFHQLLPDMPIIGCGGVRNGVDVFEHILAGASMVQVGTQLMVEGVDCFERLERELKYCMEDKGYKCLDDFRGKLRPLEQGENSVQRRFVNESESESESGYSSSSSDSSTSFTSSANLEPVSVAAECVVSDDENELLSNAEAGELISLLNPEIDQITISIPPPPSTNSATSVESTFCNPPSEIDSCEEEESDNA